MFLAELVVAWALKAIGLDCLLNLLSNLDILDMNDSSEQLLACMLLHQPKAQKSVKETCQCVYAIVLPIEIMQVTASSRLGDRGSPFPWQCFC